MRASIPTWSLLALASLWSASAQQILEDFSFGHKLPISSSQDSIPNWAVTGNKDGKPKVLSDKVILTPPWPANRRGALWANSPLNSQAWTADIEFRATGTERGMGNLQVWYIKEKKSETELASVYTVEKFDGLLLVVDQYGGEGGSLRGFLNDGTTQYKGRQDIDKLAFGHCQYSYRNLGRMSKLKVSQGVNGFEVKVDDKTCFKSDKMTLPANYYLGISAASAENPDSFEVGKVVISQQDTTSPNLQQQQQQMQSQQMSSPPQQQQQQLFSSPPPPAAQDLGSVFTVLQQLQSTISNLDSRIAQQAQEIQNLAKKPSSGGGVASGVGIDTDQLNAMASRLQAIEKNVEAVKQDIESRDFIDHLQDVHDRMEDIQRHVEGALPSTATLSKMITQASPRVGFFVFVILGFQGMLAVSYVVYKRRRANSPKKFL